MEPRDGTACACAGQAAERCPWLLWLRAGLHDLLNLTAGIRGLRELQQLDRDDRAVCAALDEGIDRLAAAITVLQRVAHGQPVTVSLHWVDLERVVAAAVLTSAPLHQAERADLDVANGCGLISDPLLLHRVLDNLLRNAFEATAAPDRIGVTVRRRGDGGAMIRICNPCATAPPPQSGLAPILSAKGAGHGLGLYTANSLLAEHLGGQLTLTWADGVAIATVELPSEPITGA